MGSWPRVRGICSCLPVSRGILHAGGKSCTQTVTLQQLQPGARGVTFRSNVMDMSYLLTEREAEARARLDEEYRVRYRRTASSDGDLTYFLGDDPAWTLTWSAHSRKIPTFRKNASSGKFFFPSRSRFMTNKEKSLGCALYSCVSLLQYSEGRQQFGH